MRRVGLGWGGEPVSGCVLRSAADLSSEMGGVLCGSVLCVMGRSLACAGVALGWSGPGLKRCFDKPRGWSRERDCDVIGACFLRVGMLVRPELTYSDTPPGVLTKTMIDCRG